MFNFKLFSKKQKRLLNWWRDGSPVQWYDIIIADGAIRSGKTIAMICSFLQWSQLNFSNSDFIVAGRTMGSLKRNVVKPMMAILSEWGWDYNYNRGSNFIVIGTNTYYLFGAANEAAQDVLQGMTAAGALGDEAGLFPLSFTEQMIGRCSIDNSKVFLNCNPAGGKHHPFYKEFIDPIIRENKHIYYMQFNMDDNLSLSEATKAKYGRMFRGVFFDRFIRGLWVVAEGAIYRTFIDNQNRFIIDDVIGYLKKTNQTFAAVFVGVDWGHGGSANTATAVGITKALEVIVLDELYHKPRIGSENEEEITELDTDTLYRMHIQFLKRITSKYGSVRVYCDNSEGMLVAGLHKAVIKSGIRATVKKCVKFQINDRISLESQLFAMDRIKIMRHCEKTKEAFATAVWNDKPGKKPERLDNGTSNIDSLDSFEYAICAIMQKLNMVDR